VKLDFAQILRSEKLVALKKWLDEKAPADKINLRCCGAKVIETDDVQSLVDVINKWAKKKKKWSLKNLEVNPQDLHKVNYQE
jgi:hypothetical protein